MIQPAHIIIVSGLPRSGTSLMMQMLAATDIEIFSDNIRPADDNNPAGYYEHERVKGLASDSRWLDRARGRAVKVVSHQLKYLPGNFPCKVIFMVRNLKEIIASQNRMLQRDGKPAGKLNNDELAGLYRKHLAETDAWMRAQPNIEVIRINYNRLLDHPEKELKPLRLFLPQSLNIKKMAAVVRRDLYRMRE